MDLDKAGKTFIHIVGLEREILAQKEYIEMLKGDISGLKKDKAALKSCLKNQKLSRSPFIRQGLRTLNNGDFWGHYLVFPIDGIPMSLDIRDVKNLVEVSMGPLLKKGGEFEGYQIERMDYSERKGIWYVQIWGMVDTHIDNDS